MPGFKSRSLSEGTNDPRPLRRLIFLALANLPRDRDPFAIAYTTARYAWKRATKAAGIEPLTFHSCRHGFATSLHDKGIGVKTIAAVGGWKSPQHLFNTYLHADEDATVTDRLFDTPDGKKEAL